MSNFTCQMVKQLLIHMCDVIVLLLRERELYVLEGVVGICGHVAGEGYSIIDGVVMSVEFKGIAGGVVVVFAFVEDVEGVKGITGGTLKGGSDGKWSFDRGSGRSCKGGGKRSRLID